MCIIEYSFTFGVVSLVKNNATVSLGNKIQFSKIFYNILEASLYLATPRNTINSNLPHQSLYLKLPNQSHFLVAIFSILGVSLS